MIKHHRWLVVSGFVMFLLPAAAFSASQDPVTFHLADTRPGWPSSGNLRLVIEAQIKPGWYLYSMNQKKGGPIPTKVELELPEGWRLSSAIEESKPIRKNDPTFQMVVDYFLQKALFTVPLERTGKSNKDQQITVKIRYMCCNGKICLPPRTKKFKLTVSASGDIRWQAAQAPSKSVF